MTPKEKAEELVCKYNFLKGIFIPSIHEQKQCALIAVEFAKENPLNTHGYNKYLQEVKEEINKL
jgi:hypothetical protein